MSNRQSCGYVCRWLCCAGYVARVMLRGRVEYHGLSRLAIGSSSLTCPDEQMKGYASARQARVDSSRTKPKGVISRLLNSSTQFSARMCPDEIPLQQVP